MLTPIQVFAQGFSVTGTVSDNDGPLPGVNVVIKGTTIGMSTDVNGKYNITVPDASAVLQFSFIGYLAQETTVGNRREINVLMKEDTRQIEEVIVTAFATQKRPNITGSISAVQGAEILATPVSNIANALVGIAHGVSAVQMSGEPGRNAAEITIRGVATYGNTTPLIVIDGIEQAAEQAFTAFNNLDANDILGISVLKDASSTAVYGIRAANGVIIVSTKRGNIGKPRVSFSTNFGLTQAHAFQKGLDSYNWALLRNEAVRNEQQGFAGNSGLSIYLYSDRDLWKFQNSRDFDEQDLAEMTHLSEAQKEQLRNSPGLYYFTWDAWPNIFGRLGPQSQSNINVSGGTDRVKYFASLGYFQQESVTNKFEYYGAQTSSSFARYNFRANVDVEVFKNTTLSVNIFGQFGTTKGPGTGNPYDFDARYRVITQYIYETFPFAAQPIIDGKLIDGFSAPGGTVQQLLIQKTASQKGNQNAIANLIRGGTGYLYNTLLDNSVTFKHDMPYLLKGLNFKASVSYQDNYNRYVTMSPSLPVYSVRRSADDPNKLEFFGGSMGSDSFGSTGRDVWNKLYLDAGLYFNRAIGEHNLGVIFLGKAYKYTMPGDANNTPSGNMGFAGRFTYDYNQRYMLEFNMGYNGTEQFIEGKRFGFFPAISGGWVPTHEVFFPKNDILTFIKVRGSYGEVGNDLLAGTGRRYLYLPNTWRLNQNGYYLGTSTGSVANPYYDGASEGTLGNPNVTWEKAKKYDVAIETKFFKDRLSFIFEKFHEDRRYILTTLGIIPGTFGVSSGNVPPANVGITQNRGYEVVLGWTERSRTFGYYIEGNLTYARNKVIYRAEAPNPYEWMNQTGHHLGQRFGLKSDGLYNTIEELNVRPYNSLTSNRATLGDIKYIDLNGDGFIDNKDYAPIGYPNRAQYQFAIKTGMNYKSFDIRLLFTGTANGSFYFNSLTRIPYLQNAGNAFQWQADGRWTPERYAAGEAITYPRFAFAANNDHSNYIASDYWMFSNDHIKLKNVELGYSVPNKMSFMKTAGLSSLRIYANANNFYTIFSKLGNRNMAIDPETRDSGNAWMYPLTRTFTVGFNVQF